MHQRMASSLYAFLTDTASSASSCTWSNTGPQQQVGAMASLEIVRDTSTRAQIDAGVKVGISEGLHISTEPFCQPHSICKFRGLGHGAHVQLQFSQRIRSAQLAHDVMIEVSHNLS